MSQTNRSSLLLFYLLIPLCILIASAILWLSQSKGQANANELNNDQVISSLISIDDYKSVPMRLGYYNNHSKVFRSPFELDGKGLSSSFSCFPFRGIEELAKHILKIDGSIFVGTLTWANVLRNNAVKPFDLDRTHFEIGFDKYEFNYTIDSVIENSDASLYKYTVWMDPCGNTRRKLPGGIDLTSVDPSEVITVCYDDCAGLDPTLESVLLTQNYLFFTTYNYGESWLIAYLPIDSTTNMVDLNILNIGLEKVERPLDDVISDIRHVIDSIEGGK